MYTAKRSATFVQHVAPIIFDETVGCKFAFLNHQLVQAAFLVRLTEHVLFDRMLTHESVNVDVSRLTDPVSAIHALRLDCSIPVQIVENDCVSAH